MTTKFIPPSYRKSGFHCPYCDVYANQAWYEACLWEKSYSRHEGQAAKFSFSVCTHCQNVAAWNDTTMVFPFSSSAPLPSEEMPEDVRADYLEAKNIVTWSPRAASALLRLAIQKLMVSLGERGANLNIDIGELVKKGLPVTVQKALDSVRVIGNNAVHPGELDLKDDLETANVLFRLVNMIVEVMITQPKEVDKIFDKIPAGAKEQIKKRNSE